MFKGLVGPIASLAQKQTASPSSLTSSEHESTHEGATIREMQSHSETCSRLESQFMVRRYFRRVKRAVIGCPDCCFFSCG